MRVRDGNDRRRDRRAVAWAVGLAALLGLIESVKGWVAGRNAPNDFGWAEALLANLPWWLLWGLLAIVIFALVRRYPLEREAWPRSLVVHLGASLFLSALHLTISALIVWAAISHTFLSLGEQSRNFLVGYFLTDVVTYWAIAAAFSVRVSRRRLERSHREHQLLQLQNARLESEMNRARLEALRRELNPHFLFNTLNSVSALARRGDGNRAALALSRLSELLRRVLDDELDEQVPVEEEIQLLSLYLDIVDLRYGDRLDVDIRVAPEARRALVPALVLQPLVENAVKHGVEAIRGPASLEVRVASREGRLELSVRNSTPGQPGAALAVLDPNAPGESGLGLRNTRDRLRTLYGDAARLELRSLPSFGAEAHISLPLVLQDEVRLGA